MLLYIIYSRTLQYICGKVTFVHQKATITLFIILVYYFFQYADMLILHDYFLFKGDMKTILNDLYLKRDVK